MKNYHLATWLAGSSLLVIANGAQAQTAPNQPIPAAESEQASASTASEASGEDQGDIIIVTARLAAERVIDVPATVTGVSSKDLLERNVLSFQDINSIVPGLNIAPGGIGSDSNVAIRGVQYDPGAQTASTVTPYINDVPVGFFNLFTALFDVGHIEVLRGPQGTLRGQSAPSGAIGLVTRRPDLDRAGGYVSATVGTPHDFNIQGGIGAPLITDVLAVRLAGAFNRSSAGLIESVNNDAHPSSESANFRGTVLFRPTDDIEATIIYRRDRSETQDYGTAVFGNGAPGVSFASGSAQVVVPAGFNGPALTRSDDRSVQRFPNVLKQDTDALTLNLGWSIAGQKLFYVADKTWTSIFQQTGSAPFNQQPNTHSRGYFQQDFDLTTHEVRMSSEQPIFGFMDYTVGYYNYRNKIAADFAIDNVVAFNGAFGSPVGIQSPLTVDQSYITALDFVQDYRYSEDSVFGNFNFHLGANTELTLGGRKSWIEVNVASPSTTRPTNLAIPFGGAPCNPPFSPSPYPGVCNFTLNLDFVTDFPLTTAKSKPFNWLASLSHKFTPDLMVYATAGTAFRYGPPVIGAPSCTTCGPYTFLKDEKSTGYEVGIKGNVLDNKLTFSLAAFYQTFDNFVAQVEGIPYINSGNILANSPFTFNAPMKTRGIDLEADLRLSRDFQIGAAFSYARSRFGNANVPCLDSNFDGNPDSGVTPATLAAWLAAGGPTQGPAICVSDGPTASTPPWNVIVRGEYSHDAIADTRGFLRWTYNYTPRNSNFTLANPGFVPKAYGKLDLFAGLHDNDGAWEVSFGVRNLFNDRTILNEGQNEGRFGLAPFTGLSTGYRTITRVPERTFQLSLRYAFGSR